MGVSHLQHQQCQCLGVVHGCHQAQVHGGQLEAHVRQQPTQLIRHPQGKQAQRPAVNSTAHHGTARFAALPAAQSLAVMGA